MIRFHYFMWAIASLAFMCAGALWKGGMDVLADDARLHGMTQTLIDTSPKGLAEQKI